MSADRRLSLRSSIAIIISAAVLISTIALGLIGYGVVRMNQVGYQTAIQDRQNFFARLTTLYAETVHTQVQSWINRQSSPPSAAMTAAFVHRNFPQGSNPNGSGVDAVELPRHIPCTPKMCPPGAGYFVTNRGYVYPDGSQYQFIVYKLRGAVTPLNLNVVARSSSSAPPEGGLAWPALATIAIGTVLALVIGLRVGQSVRRPLQRTALAAREFGAGQHSVRVPVAGTDELADLGHSFNAMADQLETTVAELHRSQSVQRRFVADVSHELRSPLATMLAAVQGLHGDPETRDRATELLDIQTSRLARILEDLLEISRFDAGQAALLPEDVDVVDVVTDAVNTVAPRVSIPIRADGRTTAFVDARRIHTIVRNLVGNALQHGDPPVQVTVDGTDNTWITIEVADAGPGIDPDQAEILFGRFVRGDTTRSSRQANSGLGLAIAAENAQLHAGTLNALPDSPTRFVLRVPRVVHGEAPRDDDGSVIDRP